MSTFCRVHASNIRMMPGETEPEGPSVPSVNVGVPRGCRPARGRMKLTAARLDHSVTTLECHDF
jgi:hypothetical protein